MLNTFKYCFVSNSKQYPATLKLNSITNRLTLKNGKKKLIIKPVKVMHGNVDSTCYIIDKKLAYISDVSDFYKKDYKYFKNLKYLIIDCFRLEHNSSHLNLEKSLKFIELFRPQKAILTNLHSDLDYAHLTKILPKNIKPAFDGLTIHL